MGTTLLFLRIAPEVIDVTIEYDGGTTDTLTGTPNHPFWVDAPQRVGGDRLFWRKRKPVG